MRTNQSRGHSASGHNRSGAPVGMRPERLEGRQLLSAAPLFSDSPHAAPATISGSIFYDANRNGKRDPGDTPLGRRVYIDLNHNGRYDRNEPLTRATLAGDYTFGGLAGGTYLIRAILPAGWSQTTPATLAGQTVKVGAGQHAAGTAFGESPIVTSPAAFWSGYGRDAQHTGISAVGSQTIHKIHWTTPVDLQPQFSGNDLLIHYGSPVMTQANTIIIPVKTVATHGFRLEVRDGATGSLKWQQSSDYLLPPHGWVPSFSGTLVGDRVYYPGAGGTIWYRGNLDAPGQAPVTQLAFFGLANYSANKASYDASVFIDSPITADAQGNLYFGFRVTGDTPLHLQGGVARISASGVGTFVAAADAAGDPTATKAAQGSAPARAMTGSFSTWRSTAAAFSRPPRSAQTNTSWPWTARR